MVKVFISHSTSSDPDMALLRDAIADGLRERNYEVLLDVRIQQPGFPWQLKLAKFLGECDAALVLVNQAALVSSWVRRETNILHWRKTLHPNMVLVTVLVGGVSAGQLRGSELRYLAADDAARVGQCTAEEAARIVALFPRILQLLDDVVSAWLTNIGIQFREIRDPEVFARIARRLGIPPEEHEELVPGLAPVLLAAQMLDTHDIEKLANAVFEAWMGGLDSDRAKKLATMVLPVWVDRDAARRIVQETDGSIRRVVILNVDSPLIGEQYLARAFCVDVTSYYIAKASAGPVGEDDPEASLLDQCEQAVKWAIGLDHDQDLNHPEEPRESGRFFLLLDAKRCDLGIVHRVVAQLHERISWMHVLVIPGRGVNVRESWPGSPDEVLVLDPPFEASHETLVQGVVRRVSDRLRPSDRGAW